MVRVLVHHTTLVGLSCLSGALMYAHVQDVLLAPLDGKEWKI